MYDNPLIDTARHGRTDAVVALIAAGANVHEPSVDGSGITPLYIAAAKGFATIVSLLIGAGACTYRDWCCYADKRTKLRRMPLFVASENGHAEIVSLLLAAGAPVDYVPNINARTPLFVACLNGHTETVSLLLGAGAYVDQHACDGVRPICAACREGHLGCVKLLSSYGAIRESILGRAASLYALYGAGAGEGGHRHVLTWLEISRHWTTPLHHLTIIGASRARALLRGGADMYAIAGAAAGAEAAAEDRPTPFSLAWALRAEGRATAGSAADLVLRAAAGWSPETHALFPDAARARAVALMRIGYLLSREPRFGTQAAGLLDAWMARVVPEDVERCRMVQVWRYPSWSAWLHGGGGDGGVRIVQSGLRQQKTLSSVVSQWKNA